MKNFISVNFENCFLLLLFVNNFLDSRREQRRILTLIAVLRLDWLLIWVKSRLMLHYIVSCCQWSSGPIIRLYGGGQYNLFASCNLIKSLKELAHFYMFFPKPVQVNIFLWLINRLLLDFFIVLLVWSRSIWSGWFVCILNILMDKRTLSTSLFVLCNLFIEVRTFLLGWKYLYDILPMRPFKYLQFISQFFYPFSLLLTFSIKTLVN